MKKTSKLLGILLCAALIFNIMPIGVIAYGLSDEDIPESAPESGGEEQQSAGEEQANDMENGTEEELMPNAEISTLSLVTGDLGDVYLITGSEIEIEFNAEILNNQDAHDTITVNVDGAPVEWEFLSYFDFGPYEARDGVVNIRLTAPLDVGSPRIQRRAVTLFDATQDVKGPAEAARITVTANGVTKAAQFRPFYEEIQLGHMSQIEAWGATGSGNSNTNDFTGAIGEPLYDTNYLTKQLGEGINGMVGRAEYLNIPAVNADLQAHVVGSDQSVYEVPTYRGEYVHGVTADTYTRCNIPGTVGKPIIVTTADEVMRHDSIVKDDGGVNPARLRNDYFQFGEDFLRLYYEFGVLDGSPLFPIGVFTDPDEYRYDKQIQSAYEKAVAEGKWPGTDMITNVKDYYVYGAMIHFEMIPESATGAWESDRFPINTREELYEYDEDLYRALCGVHGRFNYFSGTADQAGTFTNDSMKNRHPWFWRSQADNYMVIQGTSNAQARTPLDVEYVDIISDTQIEIKFNREIETITPAAVAGNWEVYKDGALITGVTVVGGYAWRTVTLQVPSGDANRLDNGNPYGKGFNGFTQADIDERKVSNGGWIADSQQPGDYPLDFGEFVSLQDAIDNYGAGASGVITVKYVGTDDIKDWDGNALDKSQVYTANFNPYIGNAYRSPLTGVYVYSDTVVDKSTVIAGAVMYDNQLANNQTITYDKTAGGDDFPSDPAAVVASGTTLHNNSDRNYVNTLIASGLPGGSVTYDRIGQRIADSSVLAKGSMQIIGGSHFGHHAAMQPTHRRQIGSNFHVYLYVEGWGGTTFQADEVLILKDTQLSRYKNENVVIHEGGHGIDFFSDGNRNPGNYSEVVRNDFTAAWVTAMANGRRWWNQYDTEGAYLRNRDEFVSTGSTFWIGAMRESFLGINDGTWTPVNSREELYRYDPYAFEVFKRAFYTGELGLWYTDSNGNSMVGNPEYRVMLEDWELLRDQNPEFSHWTSENDLLAWASSVPQTAKNDPYTGETNDYVNWVSWNTPNVWDVTLLENPANPNNQFDFKGGVAYNPASPSPTQNQEHPFFRDGGVKMPVRTSTLEALVAPVAGTIVDGSVSVPRPSLVQFEFVSLNNQDITANNAQTTFELTVNGQMTHFYFHEMSVSGGVATVKLRLDWPIEDGATVAVTTADFSDYLTAGTATRTSKANAEVKFTSVRSGYYYYQIDGAAPTASELVSSGMNESAMIASLQAISLTDLAAGAHTIYIAAVDVSGNVSRLLTIAIPDYVNPDGSSGVGSAETAGGSSTGSSSGSSGVSGSTVKPGQSTSGSTVTATVETEDLTKAAENAVKEAGASEEKTVEIVITPPSGTETVITVIEKDGLTSLVDNKIDELIISDGSTELVLDKDAIASIDSKAKGDVTLTNKQVPESNLADAQITSAGGKPVYELSISSRGSKITDLGGGTIKTTVPYTLRPGENPNAVVAFTMGSDGSIKPITNGFYNPATKTVTFTVTQPSMFVIKHNPVSFKDVGSDFWGIDSIEKAAARGLIQGVGNNMFQPGRSVTRAEFVQMIVNVLEITASGTQGYEDVTADAWYYSAVMKAKAAGLLDKFRGSFDANAPITREEMSAILAMALVYKGIETDTDTTDLSSAFTDFDKVDAKYAEDIKAVVESKLMQGMGDGTFDPKGLTTRAQATTVQINLLEILFR